MNDDNIIFIIMLFMLFNVYHYVIFPKYFLIEGKREKNRRLCIKMALCISEHFWFLL